MANENTPAKNQDIARQREADVVRMRTVERLEFREIARRLECDVKNVYEAWKRARTRSNREAAEAMDAWRGEQLAALDLILDGLLPKAIEGDARAGEVAVKALERVAKVLGTDAPTRSNVTVTDEMTARIKALAEELAEA